MVQLGDQPAQLGKLDSEGRIGYVLLITSVAALGGLLFGYDTAVIAGAIDYLEVHFRLTDWQKGWAVSNVIIGCMIGVALAGMLGDRLGRKKILVLSALFFAASAVWSGLATGFTEFVLARILGGLAVGAASILSPLYIAEVSPPQLRGRLVSLNQIAIISGMVVIAVVNWRIASPTDPSWNITTGWRWMFASETLPAVLFLGCLFLVPESPRWLAKQGREEEGLEVLARVAGRKRAVAEMADIQDAIAHEGGSFRDLFKPGIRVALVIAVVMAILQQVTGINAVVYYTNTIFTAAQLTPKQALAATIGLHLINLLFTLLSLWLVDRAGRRPLLLITSAAMGLSLVLLGGAFALNLSPRWVIAFMYAYMGSFGFAMGPVVWVVLSEIFPTRTRGRAMAVATVSLWAANFVITGTVPPMFKHLGQAPTFWIYAALCAVCFFFVLRFIPETKGRTLEEIERSWVR